MSLRWLKVFLLISLFHLDLRVKAEPTVASPNACWNKGGECALKTSKTLSLKHGSSQLTLSPGSVFRRHANESFNLLEGQLWAESHEKNLLFELPNGKLILDVGTRMTLIRSKDGLQVQVLDGRAEMRTLGLKAEVLSFPAGYCFNVGWINSEGQVEVDLPRSLALSEWTKLFHFFNRELSTSELKAKLEQDLVIWQASVETASDLHKSLAERRIAQAEERQQRRARAKARKEAEERQLRALFRKKNYLE